MKDYIAIRAKEIGTYIYETKNTIRKTAKVFGVSRSTVYRDITVRLDKIDPVLRKKVKKVLEYNKAERHIRGGLATKRKYQNQN